MSLKEFLPIYLQMHSKSSTKVMHSIGLVICYFVIACAIIRGEYWYCLAGPMIGYFFAFSGHFWFERNAPASFKDPFYSFLCDHIMVWWWLKGKF